MKFKDVPIGAKIRFINHTVPQVRETIYTRVEDGEPSVLAGNFGITKQEVRTLTYEENGKTKDAYANPNAETEVEIVTEAS